MPCHWCIGVRVWSYLLTLPPTFVITLPPKLYVSTHTAVPLVMPPPVAAWAWHACTASGYSLLLFPPTLCVHTAVHLATLPPVAAWACACWCRWWICSTTAGIRRRVACWRTRTMQPRTMSGMDACVGRGSVGDQTESGMLADPLDHAAKYNVRWEAFEGRKPW